MIDSDLLLSRLRERVQEPADDYDRGVCLNCECQLTAADINADECSNCHSQLTSVEDDYDWYNANGLFDEDGD